MRRSRDGPSVRRSSSTMRRLSSPSHCQPISSPGCGGTAYLQRRTSHPRLFGTLNVLANPPLRLCCADLPRRSAQPFKLPQTATRTTLAAHGSPRGTERDGELAPQRRHRRQHGAGQGPGVRRMVWKASPRPTAASRHGRGHSFDVTRATAEDSQPVSLKRVRVRASPLFIRKHRPTTAPAAPHECHPATPPTEKAAQRRAGCN